MRLWRRPSCVLRDTPLVSPRRCSTSGGHEWWPRLLQGEQEIDIEACEAGEAANLFSGAAHRLRLQKVPAAGLQPPVKQAATLCTAPHCPSPCLIGSHRPSHPLQVELPDKRDGKTFSKEEAERAWRSTLVVAWIHGSCTKGPGSQCPARAATHRSRSLPAGAVLPSGSGRRESPLPCMRSEAAVAL